MADFGITAEANATAAATVYARRTPGYRAPELLDDEFTLHYTNQVDIWAVGCILFELVTGYRPFSSDGQVAEYKVSKVPPTVNCDKAFDTTSVTNIFLEMIHLKAISRPNASTLYKTFRSYYQLAVDKANQKRINLLLN